LPSDGRRLGSHSRLVVKDGEPFGDGITLENLEATARQPSIEVHIRKRIASLADGALARGVTGRSIWRGWVQSLCCRWMDSYERHCDKEKYRHEETASDAKDFHRITPFVGLSSYYFVREILSSESVDILNQTPDIPYTFTSNY
jgi:hypothetical protein